MSTDAPPPRPETLAARSARERQEQAVRDASRRIHPTDDGTFVIAEADTWRPGVYDTIEAAAAAFDCKDERLQALQGAVGPDGAITLEMVRGGAAESP